MFSRTTGYAIRALTYLARQPPGKLSSAKVIADSEGIPMSFLWKILQNLTKRKLVRSFKGLHGGYELARPAEEIKLQDVVECVDGAGIAEGCVLGLDECRDDKPCPLHPRWKVVRAQLQRMLEDNTLESLAALTRVRRNEN